MDHRILVSVQPSFILYFLFQDGLAQLSPNLFLHTPAGFCILLTIGPGPVGRTSDGSGRGPSVGMGGKEREEEKEG